MASDVRTELLVDLERLLRRRNRLRLDGDWAALAVRTLPAARVRMLCVYRRGTQVMFAVSALADGFSKFVEDSDWHIVQRAEPIDIDPQLVQALEAAEPVSFSDKDGRHRTLFKLMRKDQLEKFVDVTTFAPLTTSQMAMTHAMIAVHRQQLELLDYSELDTLTGLLNRKTFDEQVLQFVGESRPVDDVSLNTTQPLRRRTLRAGAHHWLAVLDIDHFKRINDQFGHLIGDEILILLGQLLARGFRLQDKLFRFGGEEFVVLLRAVTEADIQGVLDRFRRQVADHVFPQVGQVTVSIGYTKIESTDLPTVVIDHADSALYYVKRNGRNAVCCYEQLIKQGKIAVVSGQEDVELF
jgi:diguanylate cyclase (GGDEF)-like protein